MPTDKNKESPAQGAPGTERAGSSTGKEAPSAWAEALYPASESGRVHPERYRHAAASALHGWELHRYHTGADIKLTRAEYEAAIKAATEPGEGGALTPHEGALSPHLAQPESPLEALEQKARAGVEHKRREELEAARPAPASGKEGGK